MGQGASVVMQGVRVIQGTPTQPLVRPTLFLKMWKLSRPSQPDVTLTSLTMARPGASGYVVKDLIPDMECDPKAALEKAVAVATRGDVPEIYVNADLKKLPPPRLAGRVDRRSVRIGRRAYFARSRTS